jgi:hypothetical protein
MKTKFLVILTALLMLVGIGANAQTKYYWYAGEGPIMSSTVPGSDSNWHLIEGTPNYIETGDLARDVKINWVLAIPVSTGLTRISNGEDVTDAYDVSTVTTADGVEYMVYKQIAASKKTSRYFVDGKTKYYLYFGTILPTADNIASIANITEDVPEYALFEDGHRWSLRNETNESADAYICIPSVYNVIWKDENGEAIDLIDVNTFTSGSIDYKVQKLKSQLGAGEKKYIYAYNSNVDVIKISSAGQSTWCSAYDLDFTGIEGIKAYTATGYNRTTGTIWLTRVNEVPANEGILIIGQAGEYQVPHKSTGTYYVNMMVGTLNAITINEKDGEYTNYYLSDGDYGVGFYKVNGTQSLAANRAYLPLLKDNVPAGTRYIGLGFDDGEGTTGINGIKSEGMKDDAYYTLQGQRVVNPGKGLYIKNGKKVIVK